MFSQFFFSWSKLSHRSYSLDGFLADVYEKVLECIKRSFKKWCLNEKKDNFRIRTFDRLQNVYGPLMIYSYRTGEQSTMVPYPPPPRYNININIFNISTPKSDLNPIFSSQYHLYVTLRSQKRKWSPTKDTLDS